MSMSDMLKFVVEGIKKGVQTAEQRFGQPQKEDAANTTTPQAGGDGKPGYEVRVYTGDVRSASTQANVFISLFGAQGDMGGPVFLNAENDTVKDPTHYRFQVEVFDRSQSHLYTFPCGRWLAINEDDKQIVRDLMVEQAFQLTPKDFTELAAESFDLPSKIETGPVNVKDYAPKVFRNIRELYGISTSDYIKSWDLPDEKLQAKEGAGRSGSLFLRSADAKYIMKTIPHDEVVTFLEVLPAYYEYLVEQKETLIMKVVGLQRIKATSTLYTIIFVNVLYNPPRGINAIYDLKGRVPKPGKALQNTVKMGTDYVFKDKDLDRKFYLRDEEKLQFFTRLDMDINFFQYNNLMDYSLLIGVSTAPDATEDVSYPPWVFIRYSHPTRNEVYHIGFIDCLTSYGLKKKVAHFFKSALWTPQSLSTIDAASYAGRIKKYLLSIFDDTPYTPCGSLNPTPVMGIPRTPSSSNLIPMSADALLVDKKVGMLEQRVLKLEDRIRTVSEHIIRLLEASAEEGQDIDPAVLEAIKGELTNTGTSTPLASMSSNTLPRILGRPTGSSLSAPPVPVIVTPNSPEIPAPIQEDQTSS